MVLIIIKNIQFNKADIIIYCTFVIHLINILNYFLCVRNSMEIRGEVANKKSPSFFKYLFMGRSS